MDIVILTTRYPFSHRKEFIDDEIKYISAYFENVYILSECLNKEIKYELPSNCYAMNIRHKKYSLCILMLAGLKLLSFDVLKELLFSRVQLKCDGFLSRIKEIFIYKYYEVLYGRKIRSMCFETEKTIFYSYWLDHKAYALSMLKRKGVIKNIISRAHGFDCFIDRGYLPYRREIIEQMQLIISVSEAGEKSLKKQLVPFCNSVHAKIITSHLGVLKRTEGMNNACHEKGYISIVTCSNMVQIKRIDLLIKALAEISELKIKWIHIGNGVLFGELSNLASEHLGDKENIEYSFVGQLDNQDILDTYKQVPLDLFINCSDSEGLPVSIMEAFSFGIPVIARNVGGISEIVNNTNGFLLDEDIEPSQLSHAIRVYDSLLKQEKEMLRKEAYKTYIAGYNAKNNGNRLYSYLNNFFR